MYPESLHTSIFGSDSTYVGMKAKMQTPNLNENDPVALEKLKEVTNLGITPGTDLFDYYLGMLQF